MPRRRAPVLAGVGALAPADADDWSAWRAAAIAAASEVLEAAGPSGSPLGVGGAAAVVERAPLVLLNATVGNEEAVLQVRLHKTLSSVQQCAERATNNQKLLSLIPSAGT